MILVGFGVILARAARDFFKDFDVLAPEISEFFLARRGLGPGGWGIAWGQGNSWNKCWKLTARATVGTIPSTNSPTLSQNRRLLHCHVGRRGSQYKAQGIA